LRLGEQLGKGDLLPFVGEEFQLKILLSKTELTFLMIMISAEVALRGRNIGLSSTPLTACRLAEGW
jgi:hypothetical protein